MKFDDLVEQYLTEMPHVSLDLPGGKHIDFDLELEYIKTVDQLKDLFTRILSGEEIVTHRGQSYKLTGHQENMAFLHEIKDYLKRYLEYKFKMGLEDFMKLLSRARPAV
jgi:hypothetical protein